MSGFLQNLLNVSTGTLENGTGDLPGPVILRDYRHAAKAFTFNGYQNAPKFKFLFHTYFNINPIVSPLLTNQTDQQGITPGYFSSLGQGSTSTPNYGLMVKDIKLPSFSFNTVQLNQYNRKRIIQTKIKYDPIEITFHDDNLSQITQLWQTYYNYYYNDELLISRNSRGVPSQSTAPATVNTNSRNQYSPSETMEQSNMWGFSGGQDDASSGTRQPFFNNITVFGFNQHRYTAYTFVNPIITSFAHDTYSYADGGGTMTNRMTIDYETVCYDYGSIDGRDPGEIANGFGDPATYDTTPSPIMNTDANGAAYGVAGLIDADGGFSSNTPFGSIDTDATQMQNATYAAFNSPSNTSVGGALNSLFAQSMSNAPTNRNTPFSIPVAQSTPSTIGGANSPVIGGMIAPPTITSDAVSTDASGNQYDASAVSQSIGIAQDPTMSQQIQTVPGNPTIVSYASPTSEAQEAQYASPNGISITPTANDIFAAQSQQSSLTQYINTPQQSPLNQIYTNAGSQNTGIDMPDDGDTPDYSDTTDSTLT